MYAHWVLLHLKEQHTEKMSLRRLVVRKKGSKVPYDCIAIIDVVEEPNRMVLSKQSIA